MSFIFLGSQIQNRTGYILVYAVGPRIFKSSNKHLLKAKGDDKEAEMTPLKKQLNDLANNIMTIVIGLLMNIKEVIFTALSGFHYGLLELLMSLLLMFTVIVVVIPEGLQ